MGKLAVFYLISELLSMMLLLLGSWIGQALLYHLGSVMFQHMRNITCSEVKKLMELEFPVSSIVMLSINCLSAFNNIIFEAETHIYCRSIFVHLRAPNHYESDFVILDSER